MALEGRVMSSGLPSESCLDKTVETFGLGTYDYPQYGLEHGEDSNKKDVKKSLPDDGGPLDPFGPDRLLSYPTMISTSMVPGDSSRPPAQKTPPPSYLDSVVPTVSQSKLPPEDPTVARSDYYDYMTTSALVHSLDDMFSNSGDDTYTSNEIESLPTPSHNIMELDNNTQSLGNYWSGRVVQDQSDPAGFPSTEFEDPQRYQKTNASVNHMKRMATNIELVRGLTGTFLKEYGKKDLTRRHIMSFLQANNRNMYLASDIVRCLQLDHDVIVKDVLDEFPVKKEASVNPLYRIRELLINSEIENIRDPLVSSQYRHAAADISRVIADLEKYGVKNV